MPLEGSLSGRATPPRRALFTSSLPADQSGKEIQIKMLLDAMQNSFNFVLARNAHYAARSVQREGENAKNGMENRREMCVCVCECRWGSNDRRQIKTFNRAANRGKRLVLTVLPWSFDWEIAVNYQTRIFN